MQGPEKRRGGSHVLRTGPAHPARSSGGTAPPSSERRDRDGGAKDRPPPREREAQQHLRQRDERIASLEAEMAVMEREFRSELEKLSQNESETASFWQAKHSALNRQFLDSDTELRVLRAEADKRSAERDELLQGCEMLRRELRERDDQVRALRAQVRGLKDFVSTSTRTDGQTSDEVFGDSVAKLANGLQNWVIVHFRKAKLDLSNVDEATLADLAGLVPMYADLAPTAKIHLLQSIVSRILVDAIFNAYFVGLSDDETRHFRQTEHLLRSFSASDEAVNQWRSSTLALIRREAPQLLQTETSAVVEAVVVRIGRILDAITAAPSEPPAAPRLSETRDTALRALVDGSVELARLLAVQRAVLRVHVPEMLPGTRVVFEPEIMEDVGGLEEEVLATREIGCVVFPGVIKHGDESGGQLQFRNVIAKARVLCRSAG